MNAKQLLGMAGILSLLTPGAFAETPEAGPPHRMALQQLDTDKDGKITREEFQKGDLFSLLDQNGDGVLSPEDRPEGRRRGGPMHLLRLADTNQDRNITAAEWSDFLISVDPKNTGTVDKEAVRELFRERFARDGRGPGKEEGESIARDERGPGQKFEGERFRRERGDDDRPDLSVQELTEMFQSLDKNADGALQSDELPEMGRRGGRHQRRDQR